MENKMYILHRPINTGLNYTFIPSLVWLSRKSHHNKLKVKDYVFLTSIDKNNMYAARSI